MSPGDSLKTRRLKSRAWTYFWIKDEQLKVAQCKVCNSLLSYRSSVTNLIKHIRSRHKKALLPLVEDHSDRSENEEGSTCSMSENEDDDRNDDESKDNKALKILDSIGTKNEEESVCLLCQEIFSNHDSDEMMQHMVSVHHISQVKLVESNIHTEPEETKPVKNQIKRSGCWDYFTVKNDDAKIALCHLCDRQLSYRTSVSNLVKHLRKKHNIKPKLGQDHVTGSGEQLNNNQGRSEIWSFFNYINDEKTFCVCIHCKKKFNVLDGLDHMKRHLMEKHPEVLLHHKTNADPLFIMMTNDDNKEEGEEEILHEEYLDLDELDKQDIEKSKPNLERRSSYELRSNYERRSSFDRRSSLDRKAKRRRINRDRPIQSTARRPSIQESPIVIEQKVPHISPSKTPESLKHFSNYIISLLQELPEKISKKLQMDFVKQIIQAQISCVEVNDQNKAVAKCNTIVNRTVVDRDVQVDESANVSDDATSSTVNGNGVITVSNGIVIRPIQIVPTSS